MANHGLTASRATLIHMGRYFPGLGRYKVRPLLTRMQYPRSDACFHIFILKLQLLKFCLRATSSLTRQYTPDLRDVSVKSQYPNDEDDQICRRGVAAFDRSANIRQGTGYPFDGCSSRRALQPSSEPAGGVYRSVPRLGNGADGIRDALVGKRRPEKTWQDALGVPFSKGEALCERRERCVVLRSR